MTLANFEAVVLGNGLGQHDRHGAAALLAETVLRNLVDGATHHCAVSPVVILGIGFKRGTRQVVG